MNIDPKEIKIPAISLDENNKPIFISPLDIIRGEVVTLEDGEEILITEHGRYSLNLNLDQIQTLLDVPSIRISETMVVMTDKIKAYSKSTKEIVLLNERLKIEDEYINAVEDALAQFNIDVMES